MGNDVGNAVGASVSMHVQGLSQDELPLLDFDLLPFPDLDEDDDEDAETQSQFPPCHLLWPYQKPSFELLLLLFPESLLAPLLPDFPETSSSSSSQPSSAQLGAAVGTSVSMHVHPELLLDFDLLPLPDLDLLPLPDLEEEEEDEADQLSTLIL